MEAGGSGEATTSVDARWSIIQALDGNPRRSWWHCLGCGRINQRDMLIHRRCQSCQVCPTPFSHFSRFDADTYWCPQKTEDPAPPFIIENVLQDTSTAPYPSNHAPRSMKTDNILVKEFPDMTSVYCYDFRDEPLLVETAVDPGLKKGVYVKHIFTGPYENLKVQATTLFFQIQEGIELGWQSVAAGIADGISMHLSYPPLVPYAPPTPSRPVLLLDITPSRLDRQRDPTMHSPSTKAHL